MSKAVVAMRHAILRLAATAFVHDQRVGVQLLDATGKNLRLRQLLVDLDRCGDTKFVEIQGTQSGSTLCSERQPSCQRQQ